MLIYLHIWIQAPQAWAKASRCLARRKPPRIDGVKSTGTLEYKLTLVINELIY